MWNDTYGEITREELNDLRAHAQKCITCGMLGTVDPLFHSARYGHEPVITRGGVRSTGQTAGTTGFSASRRAAPRRSGGAFCVTPRRNLVHRGHGPRVHHGPDVDVDLGHRRG